MGLFDEHCRGLVNHFLKSASTMNPLAFDATQLASCGQIELARADAPWKCGRYHALHVAPWGNAAGAMK
eukprot:3199671-Pleurochrysis_carterae.AAC.1